MCVVVVPMFICSTHAHLHNGLIAIVSNGVCRDSKDFIILKFQSILSKSGVIPSVKLRIKPDLLLLAQFCRLII